MRSLPVPLFHWCGTNTTSWIPTQHSRGRHSIWLPRHLIWGLQLQTGRSGEEAWQRLKATGWGGEWLRELLLHSNCSNIIRFQRLIFIVLKNLNVLMNWTKVWPPNIWDRPRIDAFMAVRVFVFWEERSDLISCSVYESVLCSILVALMPRIWQAATFNRRVYN